MHNSCRSILNDQILSFNHNLNQVSSPQEASDIREAMQRVLTEILLHGFLEAIHQLVLHTSELLGFFENRFCFRCQPHLKNFPHTLLEIKILSEILPLCTGLSFFQILCTRIIETTLLEVLWDILNHWCVFVFDLTFRSD